jgi:hypothetical protein
MDLEKLRMRQNPPLLWDNHESIELLYAPCQTLLYSVQKPLLSYNLRL